MDVIFDVAHAKREQARDQAADGVARKPDADARRHLVARVPGRRQEHEAGRDGGLGHAEQEAHRHETTKVGARRGDGHDGAPKGRVGSQVLADGQARDEQCGGILPDEVAKVEDAADPAVLLAMEVLVVWSVFEFRQREK